MKKSYLYAFPAVLIWATTTVVVKLILTDMPDMQMLCISSAFAFLFLLLFNIKNGSIKKMREYTLKNYAVMAALGFLGIFVYSALYYYGIKQLRAQDACILNYLWPMMLVMFSCIILKERITFMKIAALVFSFSGVVIMSVGGDGSAAGNKTLGTIACIAAAVCYGLFSVLNKKANYNQNITMMVIWFTTSVCAGIFGAFSETWVAPQKGQWIGMLWLGVVIDALAYLLWATALSGTENSAAIANTAYLTPFISIVLCVVILKEKAEPKSVIALVLIVGGILVQSFAERKSHAAEKGQKKKA